MRRRPTTSLRVALYARVSTEQQAGEGTVDSQVEALRRRATHDGFSIPQERRFVDEGCSGSTLLRPELERLRDQAAAGLIDRLYTLSPDRLARHFAYQFLLIRELEAAGVEVVFLDHEPGKSPESDLLLQIQGAVAEYERSKIIANTRRGKRHAARCGRISVLGGAPFGYRYVPCSQGGPRYEIVLPQAAIMRQVFVWIGQQRLSLGDACRRLTAQGVLTPGGKRIWQRGALGRMLRNTAYKGEALYGHTRIIERRPQLRVYRGRPVVPRHPISLTNEGTDPIPIAVPPLVSVELFEQVGEQLKENQRRARCRREKARYLLQGLLLCQHCGYALHGQKRAGTGKTSKGREYVYYYCSGRHMKDEAGRKKCHRRGVHGSELDDAVWQNVCALLREPSRIEQEYQRRLRGEKNGDNADHLRKQIAVAKKAINR